MGHVGIVVGVELGRCIFTINDQIRVPGWTVSVHLLCFTVMIAWARLPAPRMPRP